VADGSLGKGGGQRDGLDHSTSGGVVRCTGMDGERAELVDRRRGPGRRLDGDVVVLGDGHVCWYCSCCCCGGDRVVWYS